MHIKLFSLNLLLPSFELIVVKILLLFLIKRLYLFSDENKSSIKIFLLLKHEQVNLIFLLSLQNLIKGNFRHFVQK